MSLLTSTQTYITDSCLGTTKQQVDTITAAADLDALADSLAKRVLTKSFWAWLTAGHWMSEPQAVGHELESASRESRESIEANYQGMTPRFDYNKASELAVLARAKRVKRCAEHMRAGWSASDAVTFVYAKDELKEAEGRAR